MPTILSHPAVPLALALGLGTRVVPPRLLLVGVLASVLPDLDVVGFHNHVPYGHGWGHRGASHSLAMALLVAALAWLCAPALRSARGVAFVFVGVSMASHGLLDMLTNGGMGVALWWPVSAHRYFAPWHGIEVSPILLSQFFSARGWAVIKSELVWVWLPMAGLCATLLLGRVTGGVMGRFMSHAPRSRG